MSWRTFPALLCLLTLTGCNCFKKIAYEGIPALRDRWQQPEKVVSLLGIRPGNTVADIGSGTGYFTFYLADAVGDEGTVFASDPDTAVNRYLEGLLARKDYSNVEVIDAAYEDPLLPEGGVSLIFISNTYHHIEERIAYFTNLTKYLPPAGRIAIVEFDGRHSLHTALSFGHYTDKETIISEMGEAGYELARDHDFLSRQCFLIFAPP